MFDSLRKNDLIEAIENTNDETLLIEIEKLLSRQIVLDNKDKGNWHEIVGIMTDEEAEEMKKAIAEACDYINPNLKI